MIICLLLTWLVLLSYFFFFFIVFFMVLSVSKNVGLAGISNALFKDGIHPFKGPEPAAHLANGPMPQHTAGLQMATVGEGGIN